MKKEIRIGGIILSQSNQISPRVESSLINLDIRMSDYLDHRNTIGQDQVSFREMVIAYFEIKGAFKFAYNAGFITRDEFRYLMRYLDGKTKQKGMK